MNQIASVSLDLDNQWSYMKTHGDAGWEGFPSYFDTVVPRFLSFLEQRDLEITVFVVGQDAILEKNRDAIKSIAEAGHEIGNHSFSHEPWLHLYSEDQIVEEFERTEEALALAANVRPRGFRGPGYSLSPTVLEVLSKRGYTYDCSTLPTYIAPLARAYYFLRSPMMTVEEREKRSRLFGKISDGFQPIRPYKWRVGNLEMTEIPVTTFPGVKTPIHASYFMYLASMSPRIAKIYFQAALRACKLAGVQPSILLHPLDFLSGEDVPALRFFPAMDLARERKLKLLSEYIGMITDRYEVVNMQTHASLLEGDSTNYVGREATRKA